MTSPKILITIYDYSYFLVSQGFEDISHQDSLAAPPGGGNPANWILGHIITSRCNILTLLKNDPPWDYKRCKLYLPDSEPLSPDDKVEDFEIMKGLLDETQTSLIAAIQEFTEEKINQNSGQNTLGEDLAGYAIHEAFHAGELGIIRHTIKSK